MVFLSVMLVNVQIFYSYKETKSKLIVQMSFLR